MLTLLQVAYNSSSWISGSGNGGGERMRMTVEMISWSVSTNVVSPSWNSWLLSQAQSDCAMEQYILRRIVSASTGNSLFYYIPAAICMSGRGYSPPCLVLQDMKGVAQSSSFAAFYLLQKPGTHSQLSEQRVFQSMVWAGLEPATLGVTIKRFKCSVTQCMYSRR